MRNLAIADTRDKLLSMRESVAGTGDGEALPTCSNPENHNRIKVAPNHEAPKGESHCKHEDTRVDLSSSWHVCRSNFALFVVTSLRAERRSLLADTACRQCLAPCERAVPRSRRRRFDELMVASSYARDISSDRS